MPTHICDRFGNLVVLHHVLRFQCLHDDDLVLVNDLFRQFVKEVLALIRDLFRDHVIICHDGEVFPAEINPNLVISWNPWFIFLFDEDGDEDLRESIALNLINRPI